MSQSFPGGGEWAVLEMTGTLPGVPNFDSTVNLCAKVDWERWTYLGYYGLKSTLILEGSLSLLWPPY